MVICPRRPNSAEFFELEIKVKRQALSLYNFRWKPGSQVIFHHFDCIDYLNNPFTASGIF